MTDPGPDELTMAVVRAIHDVDCDYGPSCESELTEHGRYGRYARATLSALTAAGRLLPEPVETRTDYGVRWYDGEVAYVGPVPPQVRSAGASVKSRRVRTYRDGSQLIGPWGPVPDPQDGAPTFLDRRAAADPSVDHSSHSTGWVGRCGECPDGGEPVTPTPIAGEAGS